MSLKKNLVLLIFCFAQAAAVTHGYAQTKSTDTVPLMDPVVITANKFPQRQFTSGKVMSVIPAETLKRSASLSLGEILNEQGGLILSGANNTPGTNVNVSIRGAYYANTLILVDGVPVNDAGTVNSEFDLNTFPVQQIEKIEILKGSQSTLYGSDAVAGVINIITKKTSDKKAAVDIELSGGSYGTFKAYGALKGNYEKTDYHLSYLHHSSEGFSSANDKGGAGDFDNDGFTSDVVQGNVTFIPISNWKVRLYGKGAVNKSDIDAGAFTDDKDYTYKVQNLQGGMQNIWEHRRGTLTLNYLFNSMDRRYVDDSTDVGGFAKYQQGKFIGNSHLIELHDNYRISSAVALLLGGDYRYQSTDQQYLSVSDYGIYESLPLSKDTANASQWGLFTNIHLTALPVLVIDAGFRWNRHSVYGNNLTGTINPFFTFQDHHKFFVNVSNGFRVPSLYQLYSEYGNRELEAEKSLSTEIGYHFNNDKISIRFAGFQRYIQNVIVFYTDPNTFVSQYQNDDEQRDFGLESEMAFQLTSKIRLTGNYTWVNGEVTTETIGGKDTTYNNLWRRPAHTGNLTLGWNVLPRLFVSAHARIVSDFYEPQYGSAPVKMDGYYTVDLHADFRIGKTVSLFGDLRNLTDTDYQDILGFNSRGFNAYGGVRLEF